MARILRFSGLARLGTAAKTFLFNKYCNDESEGGVIKTESFYLALKVEICNYWGEESDKKFSTFNSTKF